MDLAFVIAALGKSALSRPLPETERAAIASLMRRIDCEPDQLVFSRGDPGRQIYLVLAGRIRLSVPTNDGRELLLRTRDPATSSGRLPPLMSVSGPLTLRQSLVFRPRSSHNRRCYSSSGQILG